MPLRDRFYLVTSSILKYYILNMTQGDNFCLRLNSFDTHIRTFWKEFQFELDVCDVTIACEGKQVRTHKIIISSFSPVLKNILKLNPNPHPLIYLRRVKFRDLQNLLHFMYQGEVNVAEEDLPSFLELAEDLIIKGLSEGNKEVSDSRIMDSFQDEGQNLNSSPRRKRNEINKENSNKKYFQEALIIKEDFDSYEIQNKEVKQGEMEGSKRTHFQETLSLKENVDDYSSYEVQSKEGREREKEGNKQSVVPLNENGQFICEKCNKVFAYKKSLWLHIKSVHEGACFPCSQCDYKTNQKGHLKEHIQSIHDGVRHPCNWCDYKATISSSLKKHIESIHEGVRYPCRLCDYKATQRISLKRHIKLTHK